MRKDIIPIPTLLVGGSYNDSADYWKRVNDVINPATADSMSTVGTARASVFKQKNVSPAWQTEYANRNIRRWNTGTAATYGVSEVQIVNSYVPSAIKADDIRIFLAQFTRYTTVWAFSNYLINRLDYMATTKEAREVINLDNPIATHTYEMFTTVNNADIANNPSYSETIAPGVVQLLTVKSTTVKAPNTPANRGTGKIYSVMLAYKDYKAGTGEGLNPREAIIYVPDSIDLTKKAPLVFVHPGGSGAALRFMDAPGLWSIANDEGFAMVVIGNQHRGGSMDVGYDGLTRDNANYIRAVLKLLDNEVGNVIVSDYRGFMVDKGRIYLVGHSSGCYEAMNSAVGPLRNDVAAVGATSRLNAGFHFEADLMPIYGFMGHLDGNNTQLWGPAAGTSDVNRWVNKVWAMNGIRTQFTGNATATEAEFINATSADYNQFGRHKNYTWYNQQNIPLVRFTRTLAREHNAYPEEFREIWKFVSSFRKEANGRRYYSPSGFVAAGDERLIN
jgi:poly(3-hydroxybutyrate) depolymerase